MTARALIVISPAAKTGMQQFFEEAFDLVTDREASPPLMTDERVMRMAECAARSGLQFVRPA